MAEVRRPPVPSDPDQTLESIGDPDAWGEPVAARPRKSEKRKRGVVVSVRLSAEEFATLEAEAQRLGLAMGTYMRQQALATGGPVSGASVVRVHGPILAGNANPAWYTTPPVQIQQQGALTNAG